MNERRDAPGCYRKRRHPDWFLAMCAALRLSRGLGPMRVYHCDHCDGWHCTKRAVPAR